MDDVEVAKAGAFERALREFIKAKHGALASAIDAAGDMTKEQEAELRAAIEAFKATGAY
jgi:F-type H+-transporting ATPase subunit alpha